MKHLFLALALFGATSAHAQTGPYTLPKLAYGYKDLAPAIDAKTMEIHYSKHHQAYVDNLNKAIAGDKVMMSKSIEDLMKIQNKLPAAVANNGGGHYNHTFFWAGMKPKGEGKAVGALAAAIDKDFGSFEQFQAAFEDAAKSRFGSGWAWLVKKGGKLSVISTANQDTPLALGYTPILTIDVWEHAYYLGYQNRRPDYIKAYWTIVNWEQASLNFTK